MTIDVSPIPNYVPSGYKTLNVLLPVKDAVRAIEFYNRAFDAEEINRFTSPEGVIVHAEIKISDTIIMLASADEYLKAPTDSSIVLQLYVGDVESVVENAIIAGCETIVEVGKQFYGDRAGILKDPFGFLWMIATHEEDLTARQLQQRFNELYS